MKKVEIRYHENNSNDDDCILLGRIIQKAKKNGYIHKYKFSIGFMLAVDNAEIYKMIFSHEFAKAFWGEDNTHLNSINGVGKLNPEIMNKTNWQYHLQQMVLEEEPLKYLEKFLC